MTITHDHVQDWLDRYVEAWKTYEPDAIRDLFSGDAEYRYHPWDEPVRGRDAILHDWVEPAGDAATRDTPETYDARYKPFAVDGDRAVAIGESLYWTDASHSELERRYHNCFLLRFDAEGRCSMFTEYFVKEG